jgi:hypothetical protein
MAKTATKAGGKRKIWFSRLVLQTYPSGNITGMTNSGSERDASKEQKVGSNWKPGKSKRNGKF